VDVTLSLGNSGPISRRPAKRLYSPRRTTLAGNSSNCTTYRAECAAGNHVHVDKATGRRVWVEIRGQLRKADETVPHHYYWGQSCPFCGRHTG
jgi:hypothetical protein